jgi:hypothetical protein
MPIACWPSLKATNAGPMPRNCASNLYLSGERSKGSLESRGARG